MICVKIPPHTVVMNRLTIFRDQTLVVTCCKYMCRHVVNMLVFAVKLDLDLGLYENLQSQSTEGFVMLVLA